ncbi:Mobile element protein [Methanosarcina mazei Tuc01]|uniref:Mobile element protein n=1 Tax=Methanosarcina mazei Tuc01 TaxID=1236903 RepID=M1P959_METMZ|nr:Mobile element protein [Methanosarcina mazei Tuc01]
MHLNKLIVSDFPKNTTIEQELLKYRLLNIFYNHFWKNFYLKNST